MEELKTIDIVKKYNFKFSKSLGQNFLIDDSVLNAIVEGAKVGKEDFVIEIGPGVGTLTRELLKKAKAVCAIELDNDLLSILEEELKGYDNFRLIHKDALKADFHEIISEEKSVKMVANLPYYVTTPIISKLLTGGYPFESLTIMIQKEVAERIAAEPNCKEYGALSILVQFYCDAEIIRKVSPASFIPRPKVESMVIKLNKLPAPRVSVVDQNLFFRVVRDAFNMRRKTLWNALKGLQLENTKLELVFKEADINPQRRGETLSLEEFGRLADEAYKQLHIK